MMPDCMLGTHSGSSCWWTAALGLVTLFAAACSSSGGSQPSPAGDAAGADATDAGSPATDAQDAPAGDAADGASDLAPDRGPDGPASVACQPPAGGAEPPAKLSATGCVDPADPTKLTAAFVAYEIQSPFWSDGAAVTRAFALPSGQKIHAVSCAAEPDACPYGTADDGKWVLPVGSMVAQTFALDGKRVETRFLARADMNSWVGYTYQWDEAQTDATLVPDERRDIQFNTGTRTVAWHFLNRVDCQTCHTLAGGWTLGTETAQLNRVVGGTNQLDGFQTMGLLDAPLPKPYKAALVIPGAGGASASVEQRVRSYLHGNCSPCHRPGGDYSNIDFRNDVLFADTHTCGQSPGEGNQGVVGAKIITPTMPMMSVLWLRMNTLSVDDGRMPRLGSYVIDQDAVTLVGAWIMGLTTCPQ